MPMTKSELFDAFRYYESEEFEEIPTDDSEIDFEFSADFDRRMARILKRVNYDDTHIISWARRKVIIIAATLILAFAGMMSTGAIREPVIEFIKNVYEKTIKKREDLFHIKNSHADFASDVYGLTYEFDEICLEALQDNEQYYDYYIALNKASIFAVEAYEEYITCKFQGGTIGVTLIADYEYSVKKQITQNIISLLEGKGEYYPIEHNFNNTDQTSIYFKQMLDLNDRIAKCSSADEADDISSLLDKLIDSLHQEAEIEVIQSYAGIDDDMMNILKEAFDKLLVLMDEFEESNKEALELVQCDENYSIKSKLYARLEKAIILCSLI